MRTLLLLLVIADLVVTRNHRTLPVEVSSRTAGGEARPCVAETPIDVTADEYRRAYDANEVAANDRYLYRLVSLAGRVQAIKSGTGVPYLVLSTTRDPQGVLARFYAQSGKALAQVAKGDFVVVLCVGGATAGDVPTLHNCTLTKDSAASATAGVMGWALGG